MLLPPEDEGRLDPDAERELEAVERALGGQPVDPEDAVLAELTRELHAERPVARPEFAAELDERAAEGFPRGLRRPGSLRRTLSGLAERVTATPPRRLLAPLAAGAAAIAVAVVALSQTGALDGTDAGRNEAGGRVIELLPPETEQLGPQQGGPSIVHRLDPLLPGSGAEPAASLALVVEPGAVERVAERAVPLIGRRGGEVTSSRAIAGEGGVAQLGTLEIAVAERFVERLVDDLSRLGEVRSRETRPADPRVLSGLLRERIDELRGKRRQLGEARYLLATYREYGVLVNLTIEVAG